MASIITNPADLVNLAMIKLGRNERVGSLYEGSKWAKAALSIYGQTRDALLRAGDYGFAERGRVHLHLTHRPSSYYPQDGIAVAYLAVQDADALYAAWSQPGVGGDTQPPADMPWGMHEGVHTDADGNIIRYGSPTS